MLKYDWHGMVCLCAVLQQNAMALGDFLVFLTRIASVPKLRQKMAATKWTSSLLKMVGYNADTGESFFSVTVLYALVAMPYFLH